MTLVVTNPTGNLVYQRLGGQSTMTCDSNKLVLFIVYQRLGGQSTMTSAGGDGLPP